jgi:hypothetical protein
MPVINSIMGLVVLLTVNSLSGVVMFDLWLVLSHCLRIAQQGKRAGCFGPSRV